MSFGGGMPRIPGGGGTPRIPRMPRIRDPRMVVRGQVSRNPLVRAWRQLRSNRLVRMAQRAQAKRDKGKGGAPGKAGAVRPGGASTPDIATSTAVTPLDHAATPAPMVAADDPTSTVLAPLTRQRAAHHRPGPDATRAERRAARRAARKAAPRVSRRARADQEGALWRSLLEVGRAQWGAEFDERGLDPRFITAFDRQVRVLVTVARPEGGRRRVVGRVEVEGFAPEGDAIVSIDPAEGRVAMRPTFRIRSVTLPEPVEVTDEMTIEGMEGPNGRFRLLAGATVTPDASGDVSDAVGVEHQA